MRYRFGSFGVELQNFIWRCSKRPLRASPLKMLISMQYLAKKSVRMTYFNMFFYVNCNAKCYLKCHIYFLPQLSKLGTCKREIFNFLSKMIIIIVQLLSVKVNKLT